MDHVKKTELFLILALAVAFIGYFLAIYFGNLDTEVIKDRYWKNVQPLFNGEIPIMEYPPLSLLFFAIPRLFGSTPYAYNGFYVMETYIFTIIGLELIRRIAERFGADQEKVMYLYSVLMALMLEYIADRYDIFPAIITLAAIYMFLGKHPQWAFILLSMGMMTKLYPAMMVPIFLMVYVVEKDWKSFFSGITWFIIATLAIVVPVMLIEPEMIYNFLEYHNGRPLEVGSVTATLIYPFSMLGLTDVWIFPASAEGSFGSDDLRGAIPDAIAPWLTPIMFIAVVGAILYYGYARNGCKRADEKLFFINATILTVFLLFIIVGKVFSSQYMIWTTPFYCLTLMTAQNKVFSKRVRNMLILSLILTQINFAYIFGILGGGTSINDLAMISSLIRNLMIVSTLVMVILEMERVRKEGYAGEELGTEFPFTC